VGTRADAADMKELATMHKASISIELPAHLLQSGVGALRSACISGLALHGQQRLRYKETGLLLNSLGCGWPMPGAYRPCHRPPMSTLKYYRWHEQSVSGSGCFSVSQKFWHLFAAPG